MKSLQRLFWQLWPWRWMRAACALLVGVRVHPTAVLIAARERLKLGRGTVVGAGVRVDTGHSGRVTTGQTVWLAAGTEIETQTSVSIGAGTTIQRRAGINGTVRIGAGCILAPNVFVSSGTHPFRHIAHLPIREQERRLSAAPGAFEALSRPVWIQGDCWVGVNAVICPGVILGKGSVVGANAVVTRSVAPYSVVGGAPARVIGTRLDWQPPMRIDPAREEDRIYILSGSVVGRDEGNGFAIEASWLEPLMVAVSPGASQASLHCEASVPVDVVAGGQSFSLGRGKLVITCPILLGTDELTGVGLIELTPCSQVGTARLRVLRIDCS